MIEQLPQEVLVSETGLSVYRELVVNEQATALQALVRRVEARARPSQVMWPEGGNRTARMFEITRREIGFQKAIGRIPLMEAHATLKERVGSLAEPIPVEFECAEVLGHSSDPQFAIALMPDKSSRKVIFDEIQRIRGGLESLTEPEERYPWHKNIPHLSVMLVPTPEKRGHVTDIAAAFNKSLPLHAVFQPAVVRPKILVK